MSYNNFNEVPNGEALVSPDNFNGFRGIETVTAIETLLLFYGKNGKIIEGLCDEKDNILEMTRKVCNYHYETINQNKHDSKQTKMK